MPHATGSASDGWAHLAARRWGQARARFEQQLEGDATDPRALEGLSWAAWWQDDAATTVRCRTEAYRAYLDRGATVDAARMATWLAIDEVDFHGAVAVANGWVGRAHRLLAGLPPTAEHGWLMFQEGYLALLAGDDRRAERFGRDAARLGRELGIVDLEMLGLALTGALLVGRADLADGMRHLDEATVLALDDRAEVPMAGAWACCFLVSSCLAVGDLDRAFEWCERIEEFADRYGSRYMLAFCRAEYGEIHLWRGDWAGAERRLSEAIADFRSARPAMVDGAYASLGELRRRQGRADEAARLARLAGSAGDQCRARVAYDAGDHEEAEAILVRRLRQLGPYDPGRVAALDLAVRVRAARGRLDEAGEARQELGRLAALLPTPLIRATASAAGGVLAAAEGDHARARTCFEEAVAGFERGGAPHEAAAAGVGLADSLAALGMLAAADRERRAARLRLAELRRPVAAPTAGPDGRLAGLTEREREVLGLLAEGLTNATIAERLVISEHTVHRHVTHILRKLAVPSRAAAAAMAARAGPPAR